MSDMDAKWNAFLAELEAHGRVGRACAAAGIVRQTVYRHAKDDPAFTEAMRRAVAIGKAKPSTVAETTAKLLHNVINDPRASARTRLAAARELRTQAKHANAEAQRQAAGKKMMDAVSAATKATLEKARRDAEAALAPVAARLPDKIRADALAFIQTYNVINAARGFTIAPHMVPLAVALVDDSIRKLLVVIGPGSGKSGVLTTAWPAYMLGKDPQHTVLSVSAGESLVNGFMLSVAGIIDNDPAYHALFPKTRPDKDRGWSTERGLFVTGHALSDPDASYFATGILSSTLTGKHAQTIVLDDIHDRGNSGTAAQCENVVAAFYDTILGRADPRGCRFIVAGRRFSESDLYGHLKDSGEWVVLTLPAERPGETDLWLDVEIPDGLDCALLALCEPLPDAA